MIKKQIPLTYGIDELQDAYCNEPMDFVASDCGATVELRSVEINDSVELNIGAQVFSRHDLKELRKFLKHVMRGAFPDHAA